MNERVTIETADARMAAATTDEALSNILRDMEARMDVEGVPADVRQLFEALRIKHVMRIFSGARAG